MGGSTEAADSVIPPISTFVTRLRDTAPQLPQSRYSKSTFYRNLEEVLDVRRTTGLYWSVVENQWQVGDAIDFCSGDICTKFPCLPPLPFYNTYLIFPLCTHCSPIDDFYSCASGTLQYLTEQTC